MVKSSQFGGLPTEDLKDQIANFVELCDMIKNNNVVDDAIRFCLYPFSLSEHAKSWLNSPLANSITAWEDLCHIFLFKFFPLEKMTKMYNEIVNFTKYDGETLHEAWARF